MPPKQTLHLERRLRGRALRNGSGRATSLRRSASAQQKKPVGPQQTLHLGTNSAEPIPIHGTNPRAEQSRRCELPRKAIRLGCRAPAKCLGSVAPNTRHAEVARARSTASYREAFDQLPAERRQCLAKAAAERDVAAAKEVPALVPESNGQLRSGGSGCHAPKPWQRATSLRLS